MPGLSHYKNTPPGIQKHEPLYQNLFNVTFIPPAGIDGRLLSDQVRNLGGLLTEPGSDAVTQEYKFAARSYASGRPQQTTLDLTMTFELNLNEANEAYTYKTLQEWCRRVYNPLDGSQFLKIEYTGQLIVEMFNRRGDIYRTVTAFDCFPTSGIPELGLDYSGGEPLQIDMTFRSDYWTEEWL